MEHIWCKKLYFRWRTGVFSLKASWNASKELPKSHSKIPTKTFLPNPKTNILGKNKQSRKAIHKNHLTYQHTKNSEENKNHSSYQPSWWWKFNYKLFPFPGTSMGKTYRFDMIWLYTIFGLRLGLKHSPTNQPPSLPRCASGMSGLEVRIKGEDQWVTNPKQISTTLISRL